MQDNESSDDEADDGAIPDMTLSQDPMNPWMMQRPDKSNINAEFDFGYKKFVQNKIGKKDESDTDSNDENVDDEPNNEISVLKDSINKLTRIDDSSDDTTEAVKQETITVRDSVKPTQSSISRPQRKTVVTQKSLKRAKSSEGKSKKKPVATTSWEVVEVEPVKVSADITEVFEKHEDSIAQKVENKLKQIRRNIEMLEKAARSNKRDTKKIEDGKEKSNLEYLELKKKNVKAIIDEELMETSSKTVQDDDKDDQSLSKILNTAQAPSEPSAGSSTSNIDPNRFIQAKPKFLNTALSQGENQYDQLDDDDEQVVPKVNIEEVFEEDDVVASFRQEKEDEINKDKPEEINLTLPGWGSWGGKGIKPQRRKRNRFINKPAPVMPRRDENKGDIIIKEHKNPKLGVHKVKDVPFPFESVKDYEASIRAPLGNTFIPEKAHKKLIRPSVITKAGKIIEPMDEDELLLPKNKRFRNEAIIKLLGQKK